MLSQVSDSASTKEMLRNSGVNVKLLVETVAKVKWQSSLFLRRNASSCRKKKKKKVCLRIPECGLVLSAAAAFLPANGHWATILRHTAMS